MRKTELVKVARLEIEEWSGPKGIPKSIVMIILFAYIHRLTTGETVEETFFSPKPPTGDDYQI
jgi:hypothetical protein